MTQASGKSQQMEVLPAKLFRVTVYAVDDQKNTSLLGTKMLASESATLAEQQAVELLWDARLTCADCLAKFETEEVPRYVAGGWSHFFGPGNTNERSCRFVYNRQTESVTHLQIEDGVRGWVSAGTAEMADLQDSLQNANDEALTAPDDWGLDALDDLPEWAVAGTA